jgi:hypothetical protein
MVPNFSRHFVKISLVMFGCFKMIGTNDLIPDGCRKYSCFWKLCQPVAMRSMLFYRHLLFQDHKYVFRAGFCSSIFLFFLLYLIIIIIISYNCYSFINHRSSLRPSGHQLLLNSARYELCSGSWDSSVGLATRLWAVWFWVQCWAGTTDYLLHKLQTSSRTYQASCSMHNGGYYLEGKVVWS